MALPRSQRSRHREPPSFERGEPDPPSAAEAASLLNEASKDPQWCLLLWLTMITGSRRGEICALRWSHVDMEAGMVTIERSPPPTGTGVKEKATKTRQKRRIALDRHTVALLTSHREWWRSNCAALGVAFAPEAYVFSTEPDGSAPLRPSSVTQRYRRLAQRLSLRSTRIHALRHYSATELLAITKTRHRPGFQARQRTPRLGHRPGPSPPATTPTSATAPALGAAGDLPLVRRPRRRALRRGPGRNTADQRVGAPIPARRRRDRRPED